MILKYFGHAFFTLTLERGKVIAFDPYGDFYDYPKRNVSADYCLVSHHHHDHDGVEKSLRPGTFVVDTEGVHKLGENVTVRSVATWHDDCQGAMRGSNLIHIVETEGMRIAHAGDIGHIPNAKQLKEIGRVDVLLVPVGGFYTIDAKTAFELCSLLHPVCAIPMHYKTHYNPEMPVGLLREFLNLSRAEDTQMPLLRITKADLMERPSVVTMAIQG